MTRRIVPLSGVVVCLVAYPEWWFELAGGGRYAVHCQWPRRGRRT